MWMHTQWGMKRHAKINAHWGMYLRGMSRCTPSGECTVRGILRCMCSVWNEQEMHTQQGKSGCKLSGKRTLRGISSARLVQTGAAQHNTAHLVGNAHEESCWNACPVGKELGRHTQMPAQGE